MTRKLTDAERALVDAGCTRPLGPVHEYGDRTMRPGGSWDVREFTCGCRDGSDEAESYYCPAYKRALAELKEK